MESSEERKETKNMNDNRDFKGVWIPKEVWLDTRLNALDKVKRDAMQVTSILLHSVNAVKRRYQQQFQNLLNVDMYTFKILMEESEN